MTLFEDEQEVVDGLLCDRCGRMCERIEIQNCPVCKANFCTVCTYRIGSRNYCGRACGDSFFFGDAEDDENAPPDD